MSDVQPLPSIEPEHVESWVERHLTGLYSGDARRSRAFTGGQTAADRALAALDIAGYATRRSSVHPVASRGASKLSPYIRHGLIDLSTVHDHPAVARAEPDDRTKYRDELLWQEYSRQWYAALGRQTRRGTVYDRTPSEAADREREPWPGAMKCIDATVSELHDDGWLVNQTRMWLASHWSVRAGAPWRDGEDEMFRHLLDGSRAANRQGWQWVVGTSRSRSYGFSRRQVTTRAQAFCDGCAVNQACPIEAYPESGTARPIEPPPTMSMDMFGPSDARAVSSFDGAPALPRADAVWITAESLGDSDPALAAHPGAPVHFVFDEALLTTLQLDGKRLVFLAECLGDLERRRRLTVWRGRPVDLFVGAHADLTFAVTHAPVPGFADIVDRIDETLVIEPWRWLRPPTPELGDRISANRFPSFRDWCRLTTPTHPGGDRRSPPVSESDRDSQA